MPRLDISDIVVVWAFRPNHDENDPESTPPVDLCAECAGAWLDTAMVTHPPYDDGGYYCAECGAELTSDDDWNEEVR